MEQNKILKILGKVPLGTELYSPAFGKMAFSGIRDTFANEQRIAMLTESKIDMAFLTDGKFKESGEIMLFPSNLMRNWDKFGWEKGDVLVSDEGGCCIFTEYLNYPYTTFLGKLVSYEKTVKNGTFVEETICWKKSDITTEKYIEYINTNLIESNHRVNPETLEVESIRLRPKKDNATYKKVSDKPEHEFKPFERVLVRDDYDYTWELDFFSRKDSNDAELKYMCLTTAWKFCIPYEGNEHLLGTRDDPED